MYMYMCALAVRSQADRMRMHILNNNVNENAGEREGDEGSGKFFIRCLVAI